MVVTALDKISHCTCKYSILIELLSTAHYISNPFMLSSYGNQ
jgi:hypothetical protein